MYFAHSNADYDALGYSCRLKRVARYVSCRLLQKRYDWRKGL